MGIYDNRLIKYYHGSVWMCDLSHVTTLPGVQSRSRPVVIMSNNIGNITNHSVLVVLITSNIEKKRHRINVPFINDSGEYNLVLCNQLHTVSKTTLSYQLGILPTEIIYEIEEAMSISLDIQRKEATLAELNMITNKIAKAYTEDKLSEGDRKSEITQEIVDNAVDKIKALLNSENKDESAQLRKPKGFWTVENKKRFIQDRGSMTTEELQTKWNINTASSINQMYYTFKKQLEK